MELGKRLDRPIVLVGLMGVGKSAVGRRLAKRLVESFAGGQFLETTVFGQTAQIFVYAAGTKAVLAVVASGATNVGMINLEARGSAQKIAQVLG